MKIAPSLCLILITVFSSQALMAAPLTIKEAVDQALQENPSLKAVREKLNQDTSGVDTTWSYLMPTVTFTTNGGSAQAAPNQQPTPTFGGQIYNTYSSTLTVTQPLFAYGSLSAIHQADYAKKIDKENLEIAERTLVTNVITSFYNIIYQQHLLKNLEKTKEVLKKSLQTAQYREKIGRAQLLDVLQAKTQLANVQPQLETARNNYETAAAQLANYMGNKDKTSGILIRGKLRTLNLKEVEKKLDYKNFYLPELVQNKMQIEQLTEARSVQMGKHWPTISLKGNLFNNAYTSSDLFTSSASSWNTGIYLTIPLFEGFGSRYDMASYDSQELQLNHNREQLENTLNLNQVTNRKALETAEVSLVSATEADGLAQESLAEATRQYKLATIDFLQFLTIEQTALTAASTLDQIKYNAIVSYANYFSAIGQPLSILVDILNEEK